jgi:AraC family transcriptional regulator
MLIQTLSNAGVRATPRSRRESLDPADLRDENALVCVRGCTYEASFRDHSLAVRWVRGGRQRIVFGARSVALDDDTYLFINEGRSYDVRFASAAGMQSFAVYIRRGLAAQVFASLRAPADELDVEPAAAVTVDEHLRIHDSIVSPVLRFLERHVDASAAEPAWYEEQVVFLLERMFRTEADLARREAAVGAARQATRREIVRRVALATDYIHSCYERPIALAHIGAAAALSPHHLLRLFKVVNGCTPREYLQAKRTRIAARLIASTELTLEEIAHRVGFEDRSTLGRQLRRMFGVNPRQMRRAPAAPLAHTVGASARPQAASGSRTSPPPPQAQKDRASAPPPSQAQKDRASAPPPRQAPEPRGSALPPSQRQNVRASAPPPSQAQKDRASAPPHSQVPQARGSAPPRPQAPTARPSAPQASPPSKARPKSGAIRDALAE